MIGWEAWCYRCHGREAGTEENETRARERIAEFRRDHQGSCGVATSVGMSVYAAREEDDERDA